MLHELTYNFRSTCCIADDTAGLALTDLYTRYVNLEVLKIFSTTIILL